MVQIHSCATLVYFKKDNDNLITADNHFDLSYIRNYLAKEGISTTQYIEKNLKLIYDLEDDIAAIGNKIIIFYIDEKNFDITHIVSERLKQIDYTIIWIGFVSNDYINFISKQDSYDLLISDNLAEKVLQILIELVNDLPVKAPTFVESRSNYASFNLSTQNTLSPYQNGNIQVRQVNNYGMRLNLFNLIDSLKLEHKYIVNQIIDDLRLFESKGVSGTINFLDHDILNNLELFNSLMNVIDPEEYSFTFSARVSLNALSDDILKTLAHSKFNRLEILIQEIEYEDIISKFDRIYKTMSSYNENISYSPILLENNKNVNSNQLLNFINSSVYSKLFEGDIRILLHNDMDKVRNQGVFRREFPQYLGGILQKQQQNSLSIRVEGALVNGYISFLTGYYPFNFAGGNSKHVAVKDKQLGKNTYRNLRNFLGINSAVIYDSGQERLSSVEGLLYSINEGGAIRETNKVFEYNKDEARKQDVFLPHYHQVYKTGRKYIETLQIDDHHHSLEIEVLKIPYSKVNDEQLLDDYNFLSINTEQDLEHFINDVEYFMQTGQFRNFYEISSFLLDACRWGRAEHCALAKLHRFNLDENQNILPCGGCSKAIGKLSDSYINLVGNALQISEEEQELRGCDSCPVKDSCSKCAMLPNYMNREQYCEIRRKHQYIGEYINISNIIKHLLENVPLFINAKYQDVKVSTPFNTHMFSNDIISNSNSLIKEHIYLLYIQDEPIIVENRSLKLLKIPRAIALVFEGLLKGASSELIREEVINKFKINVDVAESLYKKTIDRLLDLNYLDNHRMSVLN
ncbi:hypothetical protein [Ornithinibacillus sp. FSL M8-0202]|uniref:hypothetical protein n=1 Tax=Ornithinibacillus sp. FSL M8-0202 TaxID=2921616 RepID=UPI0030CE5617